MVLKNISSSVCVEEYGRIIEMRSDYKCADILSTGGILGHLAEKNSTDLKVVFL